MRFSGRLCSGGFRFAATPGYVLRSLRDQDNRPLGTSGTGRGQRLQTSRFQRQVSLPALRGTHSSSRTSRFQAGPAVFAQLLSTLSAHSATLSYWTPGQSEHATKVGWDKRRFAAWAQTYGLKAQKNKAQGFEPCEREAYQNWRPERSREITDRRKSH